MIKDAVVQFDKPRFVDNQLEEDTNCWIGLFSECRRRLINLSLSIHPQDPEKPFWTISRFRLLSLKKMVTVVENSIIVVYEALVCESLTVSSKSHLDMQSSC